MQVHAKINVKHHKSHVMLIGKFRAKWSIIYFSHDIPVEPQHGNVRYSPMLETCSFHRPFNKAPAEHAGTSYENFELI